MPTTQFFTVTARFDLRQHGYLDVKSFKHRKNALKFALEKKDEFIIEIPDGVLDEDETIDNFNDLTAEQVFYGVCAENVNFVEIRITPDSLLDE